MEHKRHVLMTVPELGLIAGTRAVFGAGIALLFSDRISRDQRRAVGWTLAAIGAWTTIPLAFEIFGGKRRKLAEKPPFVLSRLRSA